MGGNLLSGLPWLKPLLEIEFYRLCECKSLKSCNFYCMDCTGSPFCEDCKSNPLKHQCHGCLRVYKSSSRPGIRIRSIRKLFDVSDIQPYICNSSKLVYIKRKRRQGQHETRPNNAAGRRRDRCEVCGYELQCSASKFCSIQCKVNGEMNDVEDERNNGGDNHPACEPDDEGEASPDSLRKRRKRKPRRSPFF